MDGLYYWRYEEKQQEAKKWNGPYIPEPRLSKEQHRKKWLEEEEIASGVPASLVITADDKTIGYVGAYWIDRNAERLGMKEEARIRKARVVDGQYFDAIKMGVLREEWTTQM